jgi:hypothetical protein
MARVIIKLDDFYLEWSTVSDGPRTCGLSLSEFKEYYLEEYGRHGYRGLEDSLARVEDQGVSSVMRRTPEHYLAHNRAGPKECKLTKAEVIQAYCLREPIRDGWVVDVVADEEGHLVWEWRKVEEGEQVN